MQFSILPPAGRFISLSPAFYVLTCIQTDLFFSHNLWCLLSFADKKQEILDQEKKLVLKEKSKGENKEPKKQDNSLKKDTQSAADNETVSQNETVSPEDAIADLEEQLTVEKDRVMRLSAEFDNYRKRKQREIDDFKKFANETVFKQFLSVVDNLERAIASAEKNKDTDSLLEGVKLTHREILKIFQAFNVKAVEADNQSFDPNFHQAVTQKKTDDVPENTVTDVLQTGYLLHDRLIRPAMVVVSTSTGNDTEKTNDE
jgi:molecular chaperone GrpE